MIATRGRAARPALVGRPRADDALRPLLTRTSRSVALTESGRELATRLPSALRHLELALAAARTPGDGGWEV